MSEGTGIGLYVLVGAVIFGIFILIAVLFGDQMRRFLSQTFGKSAGKVEDNTDKALKEFDTL